MPVALTDGSLHEQNLHLRECVERFFKLVELTALSSRISRATFLKFYVSHGSAARFLRSGNKCCIFISVSNGERIFKIGQQLMKLLQKVRHHAFFETQCICKSVDTKMQ